MRSANTIRLFNASLPFAFTLQVSMCFFNFVNTANVLYVHPNSTTWTALYDFIETLDFYAHMQDICICGATSKCIKLSYALVNRCMGIQSDVHCF